MPSTLNLDYYYGSEADQYSFYRIPKVLLTDPRYKGVSIEAKVLYGLLLDRMGLSLKNGWMDSDRRVYIYSPRRTPCRRWTAATTRRSGCSRTWSASA